MTEHRPYSTWEILAGFFFVACATGLSLAGLRYAKAETYWKKRQEIFAVFAEVGSLTQNAPVRYNGLEKGRVKALQPVHLDAALIAARFPRLSPDDLDNLPIRSDLIKRRLLTLPPAEFDIACRNELVGSTMIELCLEVLDENDPIRYHRGDEFRIVSTIFGDSAVEIVSGGYGQNTEPSRPRDYVLGNSGDFISNLSKTMGSMKKILTNVREVVGADERNSFDKAQSRYAPANGGVNKLMTSASRRVPHTIELFSSASQNAKDRLAKTGKVLEGLLPAATSATRTVQAALKEVQSKTVGTKLEAQEAMTDLSKDAVAARDAIANPWNVVREALDSTLTGLLKAKADVEKAPARLDTAMDAAGSMQTQSAGDLQRMADTGKQIVLNMKITAFMGKEHKDWMIGNRDAGEHAAQTALDIHRKTGMASRRMMHAGADVMEAVDSLKLDPEAEPVIDAVIGRAEDALKRLHGVREPLDAALAKMDEIMYPPWTVRKRAAWHGDGVVRWQERSR